MDSISSRGFPEFSCFFGQVVKAGSQARASLFCLVLHYAWLPANTDRAASAALERI